MINSSNEYVFKKDIPKDSMYYYQKEVRDYVNAEMGAEERILIKKRTDQRTCNAGEKVIAVSSIISRLGDDTLLKTCKVHPETEDDAGQNIVLNSLFTIHSFSASIQPVSNTIH